ncbi:MAG: formylglycine-generating enzyme family protein [Planctomycetes bacterium]|nr:formylglycine-generating enzyme family protein [Planctomycetota bacterium]
MKYKLIILLVLGFMIETSCSKKPKSNPILDLGGGVKLELVYIRAGKYMMGSNDYDDEKPVHEVEITKGFYMGKYEVTQGQYERVMGNNPGRFKGIDNPVEPVTWDEAMEFCRKASGITGKNVRLPTEAEWEYACRAGSTEEYCFGHDENMLGDCAWYSSNSGHQTHPVGQKFPNAWGLYDMHGNLLEWCSDWYGENYYSQSPRQDPKGPGTGEGRVRRGGSWCDNTFVCRSACRNSTPPDFRFCNLGFRVVVDY